MSEERLPPELQLLLAAERESTAPAGARDEVAEQLAKTIGLPALAAGSALAAQTAATTHGAAAQAANAATGTVKAVIAKSLATKVLVSIVIGGASVGGVVGVRRVVQHHRHVQAPSNSATAAPSIRPPTTPATPPPSPTSLAAEPPTTATTPPPIAPTTTQAESHRSRHSDIGAERALVADARDALQSGDAARALKILNEHAHRFPRGQLAEERDALEVVALARAGDMTRARVRAEDFVRHHPQSLFLPSVQQAATDKNAGTP